MAFSICPGTNTRSPITHTERITLNLPMPVGLPCWCSITASCGACTHSSTMGQSVLIFSTS